MKILNIDIENTPAKVWVWDLKTRYVPPAQVIEPKRLLCFAAKWVGDESVHFLSEWDDGRIGMAEGLWRLLDQADAVLHYNGARFDEPVVNTEMALVEMSPPSPYKRVDLYQVVSRRFAFMSNSLDYVTRQLGTDTKVTHEGMPLWLKVLAGDVDARERMRDYNIGDVLANESLYNRILPWIEQHPNRGIFAGQDACPNCGNTSLQKRGFAYTQLRTYQRYLCTDCGKWSRSGKSMAAVDIREVAA